MTLNETLTARLTDARAVLDELDAVATADGLPVLLLARTLLEVDRIAAELDRLRETLSAARGTAKDGGV